MHNAIDLDTRAALERLLAVAQGESGQSRHVADLLLAWHNAGENGGFDFTTFWALDDALVADSLRLITWISRSQVYPDELATPFRRSGGHGEHEKGH